MYQTHESALPATEVKRGSCEREFDRCSRFFCRLPVAIRSQKHWRALRSSSISNAIAFDTIKRTVRLFLPKRERPI
eukprot:3079962-Pyramimonas_sp.AAC.1